MIFMFTKRGICKFISSLCVLHSQLKLIATGTEYSSQLAAQQETFTPAICERSIPHHVSKQVSPQGTLSTFGTRVFPSDVID